MKKKSLSLRSGKESKMIKDKTSHRQFYPSEIKRNVPITPILKYEF